MEMLYCHRFSTFVYSNLLRRSKKSRKDWDWMGYVRFCPC